jgi:hypothetical protein
MTITNDLAVFSGGAGGVNTGGFMRNRIINGAFDIWQRGTSFTSSSVNEYSADRWRTEGYNTNSVISQQTFTVGQTAVPGYPRYFCRVTTSSAPSNYWAFQQRIECPHNINGDGTYTLSFWVKAVSGTIAAGTFKYGINDNSTYSNPAITTTWQKISVTQTLSGVSESSGYLSIYIVSIGSGVSSLSVDIASVQVEVGSVATPFEREIYSQTLAKCQRYYQQIGTESGTYLIGGANGSNRVRTSLPFNVTMRSAPTITVSGTPTFYNYGGANPTYSSVALTQSSTKTFTIDLNTSSGLTAGQACDIVFTSGSAQTAISAEL